MWFSFNNEKVLVRVECSELNTIETEAVIQEYGITDCMSFENIEEARCVLKERYNEPNINYVIKDTSHGTLVAVISEQDSDGMDYQTVKNTLHAAVNRYEQRFENVSYDLYFYDDSQKLVAGIHDVLARTPILAIRSAVFRLSCMERLPGKLDFKTCIEINTDSGI